MKNCAKENEVIHWKQGRTQFQILSEGFSWTPLKKINGAFFLIFKFKKLAK